VYGRLEVVRTKLILRVVLKIITLCSLAFHGKYQQNKNRASVTSQSSSALWRTRKVPKHFSGEKISRRTTPVHRMLAGAIVCRAMMHMRMKTSSGKDVPIMFSKVKTMIHGERNPRDG